MSLMKDSKEFQKVLKDFIDYNEDTGVCMWKHRPIQYFKNIGTFKTIEEAKLVYNAEALKEHQSFFRE
jgi:hypothetical protein